MKVTRSLAEVAATLTIVAVLVASVATAQEQRSTGQQATGESQRTQDSARQDPETGPLVVRAIATEAFHPIRASKLIGMDVQNTNGDDLGEVEDVVLDVHGNVRYLALSFGGFLNIGDKLIAVPWSAMALKSEREDRSDQHLVLNVEKNVLEKAPGFDKDNWPSVTTNSFWMAVDKHYGTERRAYRGEAGTQQSHDGNLQSRDKDTPSSSSTEKEDR